MGVFLEGVVDLGTNDGPFAAGQPGTDSRHLEVVDFLGEQFIFSGLRQAFRAG
jgi:hypothetical protein